MNRMKSYAIDDLVLGGGEELRVVFLLESPHCREVLHGHPLAGASGKSVAKWLVNNGGKEFDGWNPEVPFGCQLKERLYPRVGLMNCSLRPMDESVYSCSIAPGAKEIAHQMDVIRNDRKSKCQEDPRCAKVERAIVADLTSRLMGLPHSVLLVPCGKVAKAMVGKIKPTLEVCEVPHPSRNNWFSEDNKTPMNALRDALRTRLVPSADVRTR